MCINKLIIIDNCFKYDTLMFMMMIKTIILYKTQNNKEPFDEWFLTLDKQNRHKVQMRLQRLEQGSYGDYKKLTSEINELKFKKRSQNDQ